ncbi:3-hydroxyacyl-CoA dehydrogenase NAD-binding domain-containing protein [Candidatus Bathyarchaeota archaeon]|nr:3-hydroxyacyl-CoA dehydrogenase NAD-binding domain-containing protein [Candidatus Bathyarchaeota archaeon]
MMSPARAQLPLCLKEYSDRTMLWQGSRVVFTSDANLAAENADLLSESVPEVLELKRMVHTQFDKFCPPKTIMTTNTSSLLVSEIEDVVHRGDKFTALHFSRVGSVVDIMSGPRTSPETVEILKRFALSLGETPIMLKKETDRYLCNAMTIALCQSALSLVMGGYADMEDVDRARD